MKENLQNGKTEREPPDWMLDRTTINELKFCRMFVKKHPLKCIRGRFYDYDGLVDENSLGHEIYKMLRQGVWIGLPKKVTNIMDALRHFCYSVTLNTEALRIFTSKVGKHNICSVLRRTIYFLNINKYS